jgi:hypothetical protein
MPVIGTPAFNAVAVLRIEAIDFAVQSGPIVAHAAFVNIENGRTYGRTQCQNWSKATLEKLAELRALMEADVAAMVFVQPRAGTPVLEQSEPTGIGEQLRTNSDAQQV